ncbi:MAG: TetR/AcrR family transcriptional regulator [Chloroflexota bacterium]
MAGNVKRPYDSTRRRQAAVRTRRAILDAAGELFRERGYAATTMAAVADRAGVALDTVYAAVGAKPVLFRELVEAAISGTDRAVPADERDYVRQIQATPDAAGKLAVYAGALRRIHQRLAPLLQIVRAAAPVAPEIGEMWQAIARRRAANMRRFAEELMATGQVRPDLDVGEVADVVWATNSSEFYLLLVEDRGWEPERFERWLADTWCRLLLTTH